MILYRIGQWNCLYGNIDGSFGPNLSLKIRTCTNVSSSVETGRSSPIEGKRRVGVVCVRDRERRFEIGVGDVCRRGTGKESGPTLV